MSILFIGVWLIFLTFLKFYLLNVAKNKNGKYFQLYKFINKMPGS